MAGNVFSELVNRLKNLQVPTQGDKTLLIILGILNCFLFGIGMIVIGVINSDMPDLLIGVLQLLLPFVGWIWAIVWGILIVSKNI